MDVAREPPAASSGAVTRDVRGDGWHLRLDLTAQVLDLDAPPATTRGAGEEPLAATCDKPASGFVSASMLALRAKLFDDGLYAAAELAKQSDKVRLIEPLARVSPLAAAAARLGGIAATDTSEAQHIRESFLADEFVSKPLGFYTWTDALRRIFQQDR